MKILQFFRNVFFPYVEIEEDKRVDICYTNLWFSSIYKAKYLIEKQYATPKKMCTGKSCFGLFCFVGSFAWENNSQRKQANYFQLEVHVSRACNAKLTPLLVSSFPYSASSCLLPSFEGREAGDEKDLRSLKAGRDLGKGGEKEKQTGRKEEKW